MTPVGVWWHRIRHADHTMQEVRTSAPAWDATARGKLYRCSCGETWAQ